MWKLRELAVVDFKSFQGRHVFAPLDQFHLSCVVGLNGSGKSNIVDALAFVLGSGSKTLRSARFAELCHKDRITGVASGKRAQVRATFVDDATNDRKVAFERVVNGDSSTTFVLNEKVVDRRAYTKALAEIGAFGKGCIVAQGYIESIGLSSAREKGLLLDSLSGSAAFKEDYDLKSKKAQELNAELKTVIAKKDDVEQTLRNMKKQVADLKRYRAVRARLHRAQRILGLLERQNLSWHAQRVRNRCEHLTAQVATCKEAITREKGRVQEFLTLQHQTNDEIRRVKFKLTQVQRDFVARQEARSKLVELREELEIKTRLAAEAIEDSKKEHGQIKKEYKEAMASLDQNLKKCDSKRTELQKLLAAHAYTRVSDAVKDRIRLLSKTTGNDLKVQELNDKIQLASEQAESAEAHYQSIVTRKSQNEKNLGEAAAAAEALKSDLKQLDESIISLSTMIEKERQACVAITCAQNTVKALKDQLFGPTEVSEKNSHVCAYLEQYRSVHGRIGDLISVTNPKHITAVGAALGRQRNMIVVESLEDAVECISLLKAKRWGVEEFIPLQGRSVEELSLAKLRQHGEIFRPAVDCVSTTEDRFRPAVAAILGDTVIVEGDLDRARQLAYRERRGLPALRIVTIDGQKIAKNGNITIGTATDRSRAASVAGLEHRLKEAEGQLRELRKEHGRLFGSLGPEKYADLDNLREQHTAKRNLALRLASQTEELTHMVNTCTRDLQAAFAENQKAAAELARMTAERAEALANLKTLGDDDKEMVASYNEACELEAQMRLLDEDKQKILRASVSKLISVLRQTGNETFRVSSSLWEKELEVASAAVETWLKSKPRVHAAEAALAALAKERAKLDASAQDPVANDIEDEERQLRDQVGVLTEALARARAQANAASATLRTQLGDKNKLERDVYEEQLKLTEVEAKLAALEQSAVALTTPAGGEEELEEAGELPAAEDDQGERYFRRQREKQEVEVADCDKEIRSMALINHQAEEMLEEVKGKLAEVLNEFESRKSAKHLLDLDLADLRDTRRRLFLKCFNSVNKYLDEIYLTLTRVDAETFGTAQIELEDEISSEPFNKGVIFHAIPPGKRYTDLDSLSGGEKAMAALSLLFACQKFKQAPFIVLDEVDAPLDLENLTSLRDFLCTTHFQIFMITLKEEIYSAADAIIGVYKNPTDHNSKTLTVSLKEFPSGSAREAPATHTPPPPIISS